MTYPGWAAAEVIASSVLDVAIAVSMMRNRRLRSWPSVFFAVLLDLATNVALFTQRHENATYFYIYWWTALAGSLARLWIMADIARSFPGADFIPRRSWLGVFLLGMVLAFAAVSSTRRDGVDIDDAFVAAVIHLGRSVSFALLALLTGLLIGTRSLGLLWSREAARLSRGLLVKVLGTVVVVVLLASAPSAIKQSANALGGLFLICTQSVWLFAFASRESFLDPCEEKAHCL